MTNVVQLRPKGLRGQAEASTLVDALGLALVAIGSWNRLIDHIVMKHFGYASHPMPIAEPKIRYLGADRPVSEVLAQCRALTGPLPPILRAMMIDLEMEVDEEPEFTARTLPEAVETLEGILEVAMEHALRHAEGDSA